MCEDNERAYKRLINGELSSNDEWNIHVLDEQNTPSSIFFSFLLFSSFFLLLDDYISMYINVILSYSRRLQTPE